MKKILILFWVICCSINVEAHSSFIAHCEDMMAVFGFKDNAKLFSRSKDTKNNNSWMKFISSDMIDNKTFHHTLEQKFPKFTISSINNHRLLFHWAYNAIPWSNALEKHVIKYCRENKFNKLKEKYIIIKIKQEIKNEQARRNREMNNRTESLFGFAHGGRDAKNALFFTAMAYNVHLLGDQQSDNSNFEGVADVENLIGQIINTLRMLDNVKSKPLEKQITIINKRYSDPQKKADALMNYLKQAVPTFVKKAQNGSIARRLEKRGFGLK